MYVSATSGPKRGYRFRRITAERICLCGRVGTQFQLRDDPHGRRLASVPFSSESEDHQEEIRKA